MGVYDRDYYREDEPAGLLSGRSMVMNIIILNGLVFLLNMFMADRRTLTEWLGLHRDLFHGSWGVWQLLTYGFVHDPTEIGHILGNMLGLFFFGREMEEIRGRNEFTRFYLVALVVCGLVWLLTAGAMPGQGGVLIGASGAVTAVIVLNVMYAPRREWLFFGILPMPAWALATLILAQDVYGTMQRSQLTPVAHSVHLTGAIFAFLYFKFGWNLGQLVPERVTRWLKRQPNLRVHKPQEDERRDLNVRVDEILEKIHSKGEASLTAEERRTLEEASRRYQRRHQI
jgi:membrane associated rhomboid family serine protease